MPRRYPEEFRRKVLDLVAAGRPVAQAAADLGINDQTIYGWHKQHRFCHGSSPVGGVRSGISVPSEFRAEVAFEGSSLLHAARQQLRQSRHPAR
ncbi:transposase [Nocardia sp. 004]|uniref:transposase n=1 Tax=Nocardia sp. 004 TaxID=3385978 RepID=UPI0039A13E61